MLAQARADGIVDGENNFARRSIALFPERQNAVTRLDAISSNGS